MQTRSQTKSFTLKKPLFEVNIDFDDASASWRQNKKSIGNGSYKYICTVLKKDQTMCGNSCYKQLLCCWAHRKLVIK
jgi:hypothetical protein